MAKTPHSQCRRHSSITGQATRFNPWVRKIPWRKKWQPTPVFLPGKFHGKRSLAGYSSWSRKELDMTEYAHVHRLQLRVHLPQLKNLHGHDKDGSSCMLQVRPGTVK